MSLTTLEINEKLSEFCPNLGKVSLQALLNICTYKSVDNKEIIIDTSLGLKNAFLGLTGTFRGYTVDKSGTEHVLLLRSAGIFLGDAFELFNDNSQNLFFEAIGPGDVLLMDFNEFENLAQSNPEVMVLYINILKEAICTLTYRIKAMTNLSHEKRYLELIKLNPTFLKGAYQKHIANYLGITPVSLSSIVKRIKKELE